MTITQEYPLHLQPRDVIFVDGKQHTVHSSSFYEAERFGVFAKSVSVETTTGCQLMLPLAHTVEVHRGA